MAAAVGMAVLVEVEHCGEVGVLGHKAATGLLALLPAGDGGGARGG